MSMEITDDTVLMWFMKVNETCDMSGAVSRNPDGTFTTTYRFRYYNVSGPDWEGWDDKNWYSFNSKPGISEDEVIETVKEMLSVGEMLGAEKADIIRAGSAAEYLKILGSKPWASIKNVSAEEYDKLLKKEKE